MFFNPLFLQVTNSEVSASQLKMQKMNGSSYLFSDIIKVCFDKTDIQDVSANQSLNNTKQLSVSGLVEKIFNNKINLTNVINTEGVLASGDIQTLISKSPLHLTKKEVHQIISDLLNNSDEFKGKISLLVDENQIPEKEENVETIKESPENLINVLKSGGTLLIEDPDLKKDNGLLITIIETDETEDPKNENPKAVPEDPADNKFQINEGDYGVKISLVNIPDGVNNNILYKDITPESKLHILLRRPADQYVATVGLSPKDITLFQSIGAGNNRPVSFHGLDNDIEGSINNSGNVSNTEILNAAPKGTESLNDKLTVPAMDIQNSTEQPVLSGNADKSSSFVKYVPPQVQQDQPDMPVHSAVQSKSFTTNAAQQSSGASTKGYMPENSEIVNNTEEDKVYVKLNSPKENINAAADNNVSSDYKQTNSVNVNPGTTEKIINREISNSYEKNIIITESDLKTNTSSENNPSILIKIKETDTNPGSLSSSNLDKLEISNSYQKNVTITESDLKINTPSENNPGVSIKIKETDTNPASVSEKVINPSSNVDKAKISNSYHKNVTITESDLKTNTSSDNNPEISIKIKETDTNQASLSEKGINPISILDKKDAAKIVKETADAERIAESERQDIPLIKTAENGSKNQITINPPSQDSDSKTVTNKLIDDIKDKAPDLINKQQLKEISYSETSKNVFIRKIKESNPLLTKADYDSAKEEVSIKTEGKIKTADTQISSGKDTNLKITTEAGNTSINPGQEELRTKETKTINFKAGESKFKAQDKIDHNPEEKPIEKGKAGEDTSVINKPISMKQMIAKGLKDMNSEPAVIKAERKADTGLEQIRTDIPKEEIINVTDRKSDIIKEPDQKIPGKPEHPDTSAGQDLNKNNSDKKDNSDYSTISTEKIKNGLREEFSDSIITENKEPVKEETNQAAVSEKQSNTIKEKVKSSEKSIENEVSPLKKNHADPVLKAESPVFSKEKIISNTPIQPNASKIIKAAEIVKEMSRFIQDGNKNSIIMKLDPENLGSMKIQLEVVNKMVNAHIEVDNENAQKLVETNLPQLYNTLNQNGIQLNMLNISLNNFDQKNTKNLFSKKRNHDVENEKIVDDKSTIQEKNMGYNTYEYLI